MKPRHRLHRLTIQIARIFLGGWVARKLRYHYQRTGPQPYPYIVLSNHATSWDPLLLGLSFSGHMYFVANEFVLRIRYFGGLIKLFLAPIVRVKTRTEARTALEILRTVKEGHNVCIFAEGGQSWHGQTQPINIATAKLVKKSGVGLITFRLEGGYLTYPRWADTMRQGRMYGAVVHNLSPHEVAAMSVDELNALINEDLYTNDYENPRLLDVSYDAADRAERLETTLFLCPSCHGVSTMRSRGAHFTCTCGLDLRYNVHGRFEAATGTAPFATIPPWYAWQIDYLHQNADQLRQYHDDEVITADEHLYLQEVGDNRTVQPLGNGSLLLFRDRLCWRGDKAEDERVFSFAAITDMAISRRCCLTFSHDGREYEIDAKRGHVYSALKYVTYAAHLSRARIML